MQILSLHQQRPMNPGAFQTQTINIVGVRQISGIDQARAGQIALRARAETCGRLRDDATAIGRCVAILTLHCQAEVDNFVLVEDRVERQMRSRTIAVVVTVQVTAAVVAQHHYPLRYACIRPVCADAAVLNRGLHRERALKKRGGR